MDTEVRAGSRRPWAARLGNATLYLRPRLALALLLGPPLAWLGLVYLGSSVGPGRPEFLSFQFVQRQGSSVSSPWPRMASSCPRRRTIASSSGPWAWPPPSHLAAVALAFPTGLLHGPACLRSDAGTPCTSPCCCRSGRTTWCASTPGRSSWPRKGSSDGSSTSAAPGLGARCGLEVPPSSEGPSLANSMIGMFLVFLYVWLPYMILPDRGRPGTTATLPVGGLR